MIGGDYTAPAIPQLSALRKILEAAYLASAAPEEGRFPSFNILVVPKGTDMRETGASPLVFEQPRPVSVAELRRLAPASDLKKSAIWIEFNGSDYVIVGLADLGTSWHRARVGLTYAYRAPHALLVEVDRPGRMKLFQGQYLVATLADGAIAAPAGLDFDLFLHKAVHEGLVRLMGDFSVPKWEQPRDFESFWFTALWNVFAAISKSISLSGHGGTIIIADPADGAVMEAIRIKYSGKFDALRASFIDFINARNKTADFYEKAEQQDQRVAGGVYEAEVALTHASDRLVEATRLVARLASCDGAIVMSPDLKLLGFGAEIRAEMEADVGVREIISEMPGRNVECDIEQFGMRHRSAIKLASRSEGAVVLAVSQDGPISGIWRSGPSVFVKKGAQLANFNLPWSGGL